jgi:16S rRNA (uracil1498-N3)-methyltransferase
LARRRFFVDAINGGAAELRGDDARHLSRVLRAEAGQQYEISDSRQAYLAEIQEARGDHVAFRVISPVDSPTLPVRITLCAALIKFDRFEWILEKATELGVERILPVETARSEKGLLEASRKRSERWQRIARESSQQARRLSAPEIAAAAGFRQTLGLEADHRYFLEESVAPPLLHLLPANKAATDRVALLTGPEGGWTAAEREAAAAAGWRAASLGPLVLRAETAALAAVAAIVTAWLK